MIDKLFCIDGCGNKDARTANLKRPIYGVDLSSGCVAREILLTGESVVDFFQREIEGRTNRQPILIAADLPIGLPDARSSVYESVSAISFLDWLCKTRLRLEKTNEDWRDGLIVSSVLDRSDKRPFVSFAKGGQASLAREKRQCDVVAGGESLYCVDHGGKQVGKAALQFWFEVLLPLHDMYRDELGIWPFDSLIDKRIVIAECYPAEYQRTLYGRKIKKRNSMDVAKALSNIAQDTKLNRKIALATWIYAASSEDEFDMFSTAIALRDLFVGIKDLFWHPSECAEMEGWILGLRR